MSVLLKVLLFIAFVLIDGLLMFGQPFFDVEYLISNPHLFLLGLVLIIIATGFIWKSANKNSWVEEHRHELNHTFHHFFKAGKKENRYLALVSLLLLLVQVVLSYFIIFQASWDVASVWYGAHWVAMGDSDGIQQMSEYFSIYPNNLLLTYFFSRILKLNIALGSPISNGGLLLSWVQCLFIDMAGVLLYKCGKRFVSKRLCMAGYAVYVVLIGLSGWIVLPYSDGIGALFPVLLLYLYLRYREAVNLRDELIYIALIVIIAVIAFHIKPYTVIVLIAVILIQCVKLCGRIKNFKEFWKRALLKCVDATLICAVSMCLIKSMTHSMGFEIDDQREMTVSHYLMMGANVETWGGFSDSDLAFGSELSNKSDREKAELSEFANRIQEMGVRGYVKLFLHKASQNFLDGTFGWGCTESFYSEIYPSRGESSSILRSWYYGIGDLYQYNAVIRQFIWIVVLILSGSAAIGRRGYSENEKVLVLAVLGLMLYLQIFESHARYVFVFVPFFLILAAIGCDRMLGIVTRRVRGTSGVRNI